MTPTNDVLDLVTGWAKAEEANDAGTLDGLLATDFVGVGPLGFVLGRDQWLAGVHIGPLQQPPAGPPPSS